MRGYHQRWKDSEGWETLSVEQTLVAPLLNVPSGDHSPDFKMGGKLDVIANRGGETYIVDHKTTSSDIALHAPYWKQLAIESQATHYMILAGLNQMAISGAIWDVVRKPEIKQKQLPKKDLQMVSGLRMYFNSPVSDSDINHMQETGAESLTMYEHRLAHDAIKRGERYFQRQSVPRLIEDLVEYSKEAWGHALEIKRNEEEGWHPRNSDACLDYGSTCQYFGLCTGSESVEDPTWSRSVNVHAELPELTGDGKDILTNSRISTHQACRRKHHYKYELGLARPGEEDREPLWFGSLWHLGQEAWWGYLKKESNDNETYAVAC